MTVHLDLSPLGPEDIPDPERDPQGFQRFLDDHFTYGERLAAGMHEWDRHSTKHDGSVQIIGISKQAKKDLGIKEYWCGRQSQHSTADLRKLTPSTGSTTSTGSAADADANGERRGSASGTFSPSGMVRTFSRRLSRQADKANPMSAPSEVERQHAVMSTRPAGIYERFRRGLLEYHSENEREYIESCRETQCLHVYRPHVAEVWRLTYKTPPPTNPRTFVVLLLSRELKSGPKGERAFMNISIPFTHPDCPEKVGAEKSRVRGKYVSVERVTECEQGDKVEWRMATSSDAGGNIPRFVTNSSLPNSIAEDVPSFLGWMVKRFPEGHEVEPTPATTALRQEP
ncbi:hypothetical protein IAU60_005144 [Kwoniella sp. DSM 27419]